jgi:hypothetical protein
MQEVFVATPVITVTAISKVYPAQIVTCWSHQRGEVMLHGTMVRVTHVGVSSL